MFKLNQDGDMLWFLSPAGRLCLSICLPSALADWSYFPSAKCLVHTWALPEPNDSLQQHSSLNYHKSHHQMHAPGWFISKPHMLCRIIWFVSIQDHDVNRSLSLSFMLSIFFFPTIANKVFLPSFQVKWPHRFSKSFSEVTAICVTASPRWAVLLEVIRQAWQYLLIYWAAHPALNIWTQISMHWVYADIGACYGKQPSSFTTAGVK